MTLQEIMERSYAHSTSHGFWDAPDIREKLLLMHSEISEATEVIRQPVIPMSNKIPEFTSLEEEMADLIIRCLDTCKHYGLRIEDAIRAKQDYNATRPYKHNKKF